MVVIMVVADIDEEMKAAEKKCLDSDTMSIILRKKLIAFSLNNW